MLENQTTHEWCLTHMHVCTHTHTHTHTFVHTRTGSNATVQMVPPYSIDWCNGSGTSCLPEFARHGHVMFGQQSQVWWGGRRSHQ
jgi:hypothetical protein